MPGIEAHPIAYNERGDDFGPYRVTGTWLDDVIKDQPGDFWRPDNLTLLGVLGGNLVDVTLVKHADMVITCWPTPATSVRLHFDYVVLDPTKPAPERKKPHLLSVPAGMTCESVRHLGKSHEVTRSAYVTVPRHVFGIPDDIEPHIVPRDEQEKSA
ncbi:hypothetical protein [Janibacter melonis]|uniref:hypothetical protein n=1 Tax=Janibacter melonis TaxID=262209 RepID=UPI001749B0BC|nr:hypothetical protein [Janibacter melonis]